MRELARVLEGSEGYAALLGQVRAGNGAHLVSGLYGVHKAHYIYSLCQQSGKQAHIVAPNEPTAIKLCEDLNALYGETVARFFPSRELVFRSMEGVSHEYEHARLGILGAILAGGCPIVVSAVEGAVQYTIPQQQMRSHTRILREGDSCSLEEICALLVEAGYVRSQQVEGVAQFSVRGGILDFFSPVGAEPLRVEFWGDEIDTISTFDVATQRRTGQGVEAAIAPAREVLPGDLQEFSALLTQRKKELRGRYGALAREQIEQDLQRIADGQAIASFDRYLPLIYPQPETIFDYCRERTLFVLEPQAMKQSLKNLNTVLFEDIKVLLSEGILFKGCDTFGIDFVGIVSQMEQQCAVLLTTFSKNSCGVPLHSTAQSDGVEISVWSGDYSLLREDLDDYLFQKYRVVVCCGTHRACQALASDLTRDGIAAEILSAESQLLPGKVYLLDRTLSTGMDYPSLRFVLLTHSKVSASRKRRKKYKDGKKIKALSDLHVGDYVVHSGHGIGIFEGIVKRDMHGVIKDYIKIRYSGTDTLFVPVTQLDLVSKYIGAAEGGNVRLNRLNSVEWQKTRMRVKSAVKDMAKELTELYAKRMHAKGYAFSPDNDWQREFEERFPYDETDDQLRCTDEIKEDMQKPMPMDRLLCGDVGFGKTEVALRAAFKCVLDGKQCAVLVPTTILAWQHYQTFTQRMEGYPVTVELLSRFRSAKEQDEIVARARRGQVDILIGTHRIVQKDIQFKDLGLCIIDEEQRFGVAHKEKFKEMRANIDVLTLSATPIPRTLNMAMSGIRDMSIIEEAPQDRHPVQTYVMEHDMGVLAQAIHKELRRGGQVFYLHNRTDSIDSCAARILEMVPQARIVTAHGKIGEERLSEVWRQLVEHEVDVLVCTTIIETGVDVPNCNTLIIEDADRLGLSQLYQLRGRVGRSNRRAYAYLTFHKGKTLTEVATKRLSAIREFTTFGSGFRIAMRDLEIRGAGSILGAQQHGHMEAVGYDLYLKLLGEAVREEQGGEPILNTECIIDVRISAYIPEDYIENLSQRIDVYKKIAAVGNAEDAMDVLDELIDRFGDPPQAVKGLVDVALMRGTASQLGVTEVTQKGDQILLYPQQLQVDVAGQVASRMKGRVLVNAGAKPYFAVRVPTGTDPVDTIRETLANMVVTPKNQS